MPHILLRNGLHLVDQDAQLKSAQAKVEAAHAKTEAVQSAWQEDMRRQQSLARSPGDRSPSHIEHPTVTGMY